MDSEIYISGTVIVMELRDQQEPDTLMVPLIATYPFCQVKEMTAFGRQELVSQLPEEFLLASSQKSSYNLGLAHFLIDDFPLESQGIGASFGPGTNVPKFEVDF